MTKRNKLLAVLWKLSRIHNQERRVLDIDIDEALAQISDEELDFYYNKLVKGV